MPASELDFYSCQHLRWTFVGASILAGLLSLPASPLDLSFIFPSTSSSTASVSCWTCLGLMPSHGLTGSFSFWSADSFRGPSPGTLFFIVSWTLLGGPRTLFLFSVDSSSTASLRAGLYFVDILWIDGQRDFAGLHFIDLVVDGQHPLGLLRCRRDQSFVVAINPTSSLRSMFA